jgi:hypothetical protein
VVPDRVALQEFVTVVPARSIFTDHAEVAVFPVFVSVTFAV